MKVKHAMQKHVDYVTTDVSVKEVAVLIFGRNINGIPVCKGKKVVGFITEKDILRKFYPSMQEYIEDRVHATDFEGMEKKVDEILSKKAEEVMSTNPITVTPDTPLLQAESLMLTKKVGRLPVVDKRGILRGIIAKKDIFRAIVGERIPYVEDEKYHDWLARHYDDFVDWQSRLKFEIPALVKVLRKYQAKNVLDIGCGTGEHAIALGKKGFEATGIEKSNTMYQIAKKKWRKLNQQTKKKVRFIQGDYLQIIKKIKKNQQLDAVIMMGNALAHNPTTYQKLLETISKNLEPKNSVFICQILNFEKIFKVKNRLAYFKVGRSKIHSGVEHVFLEFYDPPRRKGGALTLTMFILSFNRKRWVPHAINSTPIANLTEKNLLPILKRLGFRKIEIYGSEFMGPFLTQKFKPFESDWLNILAVR